jgi:hypothetical protein
MRSIDTDKINVISSSNFNYCILGIYCSDIFNYMFCFSNKQNDGIIEK